MDKQGNTIAGRKRNDEFDFYETPKWATEKAVEAMLTDEVTVIDVIAPASAL